MMCAARPIRTTPPAVANLRIVRCHALNQGRSGRMKAKQFFEGVLKRPASRPP